MRLTAKTALGIEISDGRINLALLKKCANGVQLLKAASGPVPAGAIKDGNVEDPLLLAGAVRKLKVSSRIGAHHPAVLSVVAYPVLTQILDLGDDVPANIGDFVRNEVKHCAMLPAGKVTSDFCGLKSVEQSSVRRVLVTAAETQKLRDPAAALESNGFNIVAIEPACLAYIRACYDKRIAKRFDQNVLFVMVHQNILSLYLFRNETLNFVTTKVFEPNDGDGEKCIQWLAEEISAVMRFYDFEILEKRSKWDVEIVTDDCSRVPKEIFDILPLTVSNTGDMKIKTFKESSADTPLVNPNPEGDTSAVAVGLAMKLLESGDFTPSVNLLPAKQVQAKFAKKQRWVITNVAAIVLLSMIISIGLFNSKLSKLTSNTNQKMRTEALEDMQILLQERTSLDRQVKEKSENLSNISSGARSSNFLRWDLVLEQIAYAIPGSVQIRSLSSDSGSMIVLEGQALSYEAVELFVDTLGKCDCIKSASLAGTEKDGKSNRWVRYSIGCSLIDRKEYQ